MKPARFRSTALTAAALLLVALPFATPLSAQALEDDPHAACAMSGWVPREILGRPVPLRQGTGNTADRVTTASPEAQALYDQGMNYLHGYVWIEAARSFQEALRRDPELALAHVGLSRAYSGLDDPAAARASVERAQALAGKASAREQRRIALRAKQLDATLDLASAAKHAEYKRAIDDAIARDLDDVELWLIRGNAEEPTAAGRGQRGGAASTAFYHRALQIAPDNGAAHHYLTHSYETIGQIPPALVHGEVYARVAPSIPHSHHMWGHDLRRVGRIDDAIAAFLRSDQLEKAYYAAEGIAPNLDWHHIHNLDLLATAYQHKGQMRQAEAVLREAKALAPVTDYLEFNQKALPMFLLGRERFEEALGEAEKLVGGQFAVARAVGHALAGNAYLALGKQAAARQALAGAEREMSAVPAVTGTLVSQGSVKPYVEMLRGELMLRDGKADGRAALLDVAKTLRAQQGPDAWIAALFRLEAIARLARDAGDWELAEHIAREMMDHDAAYAGSHYASACVARHKGDLEGARKAMAEAERHWRDADPGLSEAERARVAAVGVGPEASGGEAETAAKRPR